MSTNRYPTRSTRPLPAAHSAAFRPSKVSRAKEDSSFSPSTFETAFSSRVVPGIAHIKPADIEISPLLAVTLMAEVWVSMNVAFPLKGQRVLLPIMAAPATSQYVKDRRRWNEPYAPLLQAVFSIFQQCDPYREQPADYFQLVVAGKTGYQFLFLASEQFTGMKEYWIMHCASQVTLKVCRLFASASRSNLTGRLIPPSFILVEIAKIAEHSQDMFQPIEWSWIAENTHFDTQSDGDMFDPTNPNQLFSPVDESWKNDPQKRALLCMILFLEPAYGFFMDGKCQRRPDFDRRASLRDKMCNTIRVYAQLRDKLSKRRKHETKCCAEMIDFFMDRLFGRFPLHGRPDIMLQGLAVKPFVHSFGKEPYELALGRQSL
ncbi:putative mitochondrial protein [Andalucia godoyi]|uniref:Putative mitochondrial protein n=1 Tax=Andalucia godoyi TaxID=505711 RepID=A0A8K0AGQ6_ANDGO|nr:putative mitochondrial protein [Andalucia godoyi]|eukprot:ANDGO_07254.mRNA.1 putative mitochondrial protein